MPELPEVEAVCRRLRKQALGAEIAAFQSQRPSVTSPQTPDAIAHASAGARIQAVRRRGKNILLDFNNGFSLRIHLRMTGDLYVIPDPRFRPITARAWFHLADGRALVFDDSRALGKINAYPTPQIESILGHLGVEPLSKSFHSETLVEAARNSHKPVKLLLLDQTIVAGLGNIYAAEALFHAGIDPRLPAYRIRAARLRRLHEEIVRVLRTAVQSSSIAYMSPGRFTEAESFPLAVYDREGGKCGICGRNIRRVQQGGRSTYFCPGCQR